MDENTKEVKVIEPLEGLPGWTEKELAELQRVTKDGVKPISPTLGAQMLALFLEGYSCNEIAKQNKPFSEGDILYCRKKFNWDEEKERYAFDLNRQIREKLQKTKLESIEFLTNSLAIVHKAAKEKQLKYLQTGKEEDLPKGWELSPSGYKSIFETIQKVTGEDRTSKQEIRSESTVRVEGSLQSSAIITPELQSRMLKRLAAMAGEPKKNEDGSKDE